MSSIQDIHGILAIISRSGPEGVVTSFPLTKSTSSLVKLIGRNLKARFFILRKRLFIFKYNIEDPYERIYENYWQQIFWN